MLCAIRPADRGGVTGPALSGIWLPCRQANGLKAGTSVRQDAPLQQGTGTWSLYGQGFSAQCSFPILEEIDRAPLAAACRAQFTCGSPSRLLANAAPAGNQHQQASCTPPRRATAAPIRPTAPPPPAPAAPSPLGGPASSARCPPTLRSPPRPRGAANRAGERVTPLFLLEPPGPVAQRT